VPSAGDGPAAGIGVGRHGLLSLACASVTKSWLFSRASAAGAGQMPGRLWRVLPHARGVFEGAAKRHVEQRHNPRGQREVLREHRGGHVLEAEDRSGWLAGRVT